MISLASRSFAFAAAVGTGLFGVVGPSFAAHARPPLHVKVRYRAATDEYCIALTGLERQRTDSLLPAVDCESKAGWAVEGLTISRD